MKNYDHTAHYFAIEDTSNHISFFPGVILGVYGLFDTNVLPISTRGVCGIYIFIYNIGVFC